MQSPNPDSFSGFNFFKHVKKNQPYAMSFGKHKRIESFPNHFIGLASP